MFSQWFKMASEGHSSYFDYNIRLMRTICLWPLETNSIFWNSLNTLYIAIMGVLLAVTSVGQVIEIFVSPNISSMASAVDIMTLTSSALFKMINILLYQKHFQHLVLKMNGIFVEKDFLEGTFCMQAWLKNYKVYIRIYVLSSFLTLFIFFWIAPYVTSQYDLFDSPMKQMKAPVISGLETYSVIKTYDTNNNNPGNEKLTAAEDNVNNDNILSNITSTHWNNSLGIDSAYPIKKKKFPLNCWFPIDVTWSPLYEIIYLVEIFPLIGSAHLYLVSDSFFFMIIYLLCGQLEILKISLKGVQKNFDELSSMNGMDLSRYKEGKPGKLWDFYSKERQIEAKLNEIVIKCINFHVALTEIICELDLMLRSMIVVDFLHAVISLSFAMLQTITSNGVLEWVQMILFIGVCVLHQFLNNLFSELLVQQQVSVGEAAYMVPWEQVPSLRLPASMLMAQARHPVRLSGWKMYILGLGTFIEFMKLLISYFLVLQSLHLMESKGIQK